MTNEPLIVDEACWERGCACHDSRDSPGIQLVERREWVGLTDDEIKTIAFDTRYTGLVETTRAIESKLKEKNSAATRMDNGSATTKPVA